MCRMLGAVGSFEKEQIFEAVTAMSECRFATHEHGTTSRKPWNHPHGWGAAYRAIDGTLRSFKDDKAMTLDAVKTALGNASDGLLVIHARRASDEAKMGTDYVHPIEFDLAGSKAFFFHNGYVPDAYELLPGAERTTWDTALLLEILKPAFNSADRETEIRKALEKLPATTNAANFILAEPGRLTLGNWFKEGLRPQYYTMHSLETETATMISSEPITHIAPLENWKPIGNRTLRVVEAPLPAKL